MTTSTAPTTSRPPVAKSSGTRRTRAANVLLLLGGLNLGVVAALGLARLGSDATSPGGLALWGGRMTGLLAEVLVLATVLLAARVPWLERAAGQDRLLRWHRTLGPLALITLVAHPVLLAASYSAGRAGGLLTQLWSLGTSYAAATVGAGLFVGAGVLSVRPLRKRMPYEAWYVAHLGMYAAVLLAFGHQLSAGSAVLHDALVRGWWTAQLVLVFAAVLVYRVAIPMYRSIWHAVRVDSVVRESADVVSVHLTGHHLDQLEVMGGQFFRWRFLTPTGWWRSHPYSISAPPQDDRMRLTAREVGAGSRALAHLRPGTRVVLEGPYGVLTSDVRTRDRVLLIGAGSGIGPIRALLDHLPPEVDAVVIQRASDVADAVLHHELRAVAASRAGTRVELVVGPRGAPDDDLRPLGPTHLAALVPDLADRDVYVCGPPGLTASLQTSLRRLRVPPAQIHIESFEL